MASQDSDDDMFCENNLKVTMKFVLLMCAGVVDRFCGISVYWA